MKQSEKLMKEAKAMRRIAIVGSVLIPGPQWIPAIISAERKENMAKVMTVEGLTGIVIDMAEKNPVLVEEFITGFMEFARKNMGDMVNGETKENNKEVTEI